MPNGDPDFYKKEFVDLESLFSKISNVLEEFSKERHLLIEKYYHQNPSWDFLFKHPKGGSGKMEVLKSGDEMIEFHLIWWFDDYDLGTRSIKRQKLGGKKVEDIKPCLKKELNDILDLILSWKFGDWDKVVKGFKKDWQKTFTKESFYSQNDRFPLPKL